MSVEALPKRMREKILADVAREYTRRPNEVHVTELVYCPRKATFRRLLGDEELTVGRAFPLWRGELMDGQLTSLFERQQVRLTHRVRGTPVVIVGRYDFLDSDPKDLPEGVPEVLYELKTTGSLFYVKEPQRQHRNQVLFYLWATGLNRARLLYMDFKEARAFDVTATDEELERAVAEMEQKAKAIHDSTKTEKPAVEKGEAWECRFCAFVDRCKAYDRELVQAGVLRPEEIKYP